MVYRLQKRTSELLQSAVITIRRSLCLYFEIRATMRKPVELNSIWFLSPRVLGSLLAMEFGPLSQVFSVPIL